MTSVEEVMASLNPKLKKSVMRASAHEDAPKLPLPSVGLTNALNGGFQLGRQVLVWGNKSSGKSSFCLQMIGMAQKEGLVCAWIDAEMSYDAEWAKRLGVDSENLIYSEARTINDMVDVSKELIDAGTDVIVVDSLTSLLPAIYFDKGTSNLKDLENTKQIGAESRDFSNAWKMINYANNRKKPTLIVLISQARNKISPTYTKLAPTGGNATQFYSSTIVRLFSSESEGQAISGTVAVGDKLLNEKVGRKVLWDLQFSKTSPGMVSGEYDFYFRGDEVGVDTVGELVDTCIVHGVIEKGGAWLTVDGERYQGRANAVEAVRSNLTLQETLLEALKSSGAA